MNRALLAVLIAAPFVVFAMSCERERLVRMAKESADRQAEQNNEMSRLNREVAQSHRELVELQRDVEERAATVSGQRDLLEEERRQIAGERARESILGPLIANLGPLLVCALVLLFCSILLVGLRAERDGDAASTTRIAPAGAKENTGANHLSPLPGLRVLDMPRDPTACAVGYCLPPLPGLVSTASTGVGRPSERRVYDLHVQRHQQVAAGILAKRKI